MMLSLLVCLAAECGGGVEPQPEPLDVPTGVSVHSVTKTSLTFQWSPVTGATSYGWKLTQDGTQVQAGTAKARNVTVSGLTAGTTYQFSVCAVSDAASSGYSAPVTATTEAEPEPPGPGPSQLDYADFVIPSWEEDGVVRAFPGAEGGGMYTTGGRGGRDRCDIHGSAPGTGQGIVGRSEFSGFCRGGKSLG